MGEQDNVKFVDLSTRNSEFRQHICEAIGRVVDGGIFIGGEAVEKFEQEFADYIGVRHCIGVGNGLDALRIALTACGVAEGDEVIVPAQTFIATWLAVSQIGAVPIPVDIESSTALIDLERIESAISPRSTAIVAVHLHGRSCDLIKLRAIAEKYGLILIEDAAQAHGAIVEGQRIGSFGHAAAFSFYPSKNLGALGDAGAITTNSQAIASRVRLWRSYGSDESARYEHQVQGWNSRLDPIQAAVLLGFLPHLDEWNDRRRYFASQYREKLAGLNLFEELDGKLPLDKSVWHHFVIRSRGRDALQRALLNRGVSTQVHYPVMPGMTRAYRRPSQSERELEELFPCAFEHSRTVLSLPMHPWLNQDIATVIQSLQEIDSST